MKKTKQLLLLMLALISLSTYSDAQGTWAQKTSLTAPQARWMSYSFSIGSKGYLGSGSVSYTDGGAFPNDLWEYDPTNDSWTQKANSPGAGREGAVGFSIGTNGYMGTGYGGPYSNDFYEYNSTTNTWTQKANFGGAGRYGAFGFSIGTKGYIGSGTGGQDFWEYNPATDTWLQKANYPGAGWYTDASFAIGSKGYAGAGTGNSDFYEYDPATDVWTQKANVGGGGRSWGRGLAIGNKGYIGMGSYSDFWQYTPSTDSWMQMTNYPSSSNQYLATFSINNKGYFGSGGIWGGASVNEFYEFTPPAQPNPIIWTKFHPDGLADYGVNGGLEPVIQYGWNNGAYGSVINAGQDFTITYHVRTANVPGYYNQIMAAYSKYTPPAMGNYPNQLINYSVDNPVMNCYFNGGVYWANFYYNSVPITANQLVEVIYTRISGVISVTIDGTGWGSETYNGSLVPHIIIWNDIGGIKLESATVVVSGACSSPAAPVITGPNAVCQMTTGTYTATSLTASSFTWTVPAGLTITSGQGTASINVTISAGTISGNVTATATNACGTSAVTNYMVTKKPQTPANITGPTDICGLTSATYSIPTTFGATSYTWTVPAGMTITAGAGTTSVTVSIASSLTLGAVKVMAVNGCGSVPGTQLIVYGKAAPGTITGPPNVCGMTTASYSCNVVSNATSYVWTVPATWSILSGQGTNNMTATMPVNVNNATFSGVVKVHAVSACGNSAAKSMTVSFCKSAIGMNNGGVEENSLSLYPNPASALFNLNLTSEDDTEVTMQVYDVLGNLVISDKHQLTSGGNTITTNVENFKSGMYFIRLVDGLMNTVYSQSLMKE